MKKILIIALILTGLISSCRFFMEERLLKSKDQREEINKKFGTRVQMIQDHDPYIKNILSQELPAIERDGFEFIYSYMPLSDVAMHNSRYVLDQVQLAIEAKKFFKWGKKIPADIFLHYVLPYRINNEYTDTARQVFFHELKNRIKGMNMYDAALEVNYWCHEKVTYKSTDERTAGPLTSVRAAFGRCGEESTFTVAALRSVSIPARQVYTPRWAHTDDNHAWVEVWVNGKWYFMGACEPDPELNMGWFAGPVKRAMMTRTFVFGKYEGKEEKLTQSDFFTEINLLPNYTSTKTLNVKVLNEQGNPVPEATVEFQLYNYSEFYPVAKHKTNAEGVCSLTTGFGDLMIWASKGNSYGFVKADGDATDVSVELSSIEKLKALDLILIPPKEQSIAQADKAKVDANNIRLKQGEQIRNAFVSTFIDSVSAANLALSKGAGINDTWQLLKKSRGNWEEIYTFIKDLDPNDMGLGIAILKNISEKDLRDITTATLMDHVSNAYTYPPLVDSKNINQLDSYVLSPRVGREFVTPWRSFMQQNFSYDEIGFARNNPYNLAKWITENIEIDTESNYYRVPLSPESVYTLKKADAYSRSVFFVAACRSFGVPARLEPSTKRPQFMKNDEWNDVLFDQQTEKGLPKGSVNITLSGKKIIENPLYYTHYTIARLDGERFVTLDFENDELLKSLPATITVDEGIYRMVTGNRQSDGTVLCKVQYFEVKPNQTTAVAINFIERSSDQKIIGSLEIGTLIPEMDGKEIKPLAEFIGSNGAVLAIIDPVKEPTKHLMKDIAAISENLEKWGGTTLFVVGIDKMVEGFGPDSFTKLPKNAVFGYDKQQNLAKAVANGCSKTLSVNYPIVVVVNANGETTFYSEGYSIGLGEQILKSIKP